MMHIFHEAIALKYLVTKFLIVAYHSCSENTETYDHVVLKMVSSG